MTTKLTFLQRLREEISFLLLLSTVTDEVQVDKAEDCGGSGHFTDGVRSNLYGYTRGEDRKGDVVTSMRESFFWKTPFLKYMLAVIVRLLRP